MMREKGKGLAALVPEANLSEKLSDSNDPKLDRVIQTRIGDHLRAMYDDLMQQPVPDRFKDLLTQLERKDEENSK